MIMSRLSTDNGRTTECEDRARILDTEFAIIALIFRKRINPKIATYFFCHKITPKTCNKHIK